MRILSRSKQQWDYLLHFGVKDVDRINKNLRTLWQFIYRIVNGYEPRIKVVIKDLDNLLVSWIVYG
jgi:hypothetical protein